MKFWKRAAVFTIGAAILAGSLTGCGRTPDSETDLQIHYWRSGYGEAYLNAIIKEFEEEYPQYNVILDVTADNSQLASTIKLGGNFNPVDLYMSVTPSAKIRREYAEPLDDILEFTNPGENKTIGEKYDQEFLKYMQTEGSDGEKHYYALSYAGGWAGIVYNADVIDGQKFEVPLTTDELEILAIDLDAEGYTPFIHYNSTFGGYWEYAFKVWQAQYRGLDFYLNTFYGLKDEEGNSPSYNRLIDDMDGDGNEDKSDGRWQVLEFMEKIITPTYVKAGSNSSKFDEAQLEFFNDAAVMMVNGSWLQNEMGNRNKNLKLMKMPVLSAIIDRCPSIADDTELAAVIRAVDAAGADVNSVPLEGTGYAISEADRAAVYEARNLLSGNFDQHGFIIPNYATAKQAAKDFIKFFYRDSSLVTFINTLHILPVIGLDDESLMPDTTAWTQWEKEQTKFFESSIPLMEASGNPSVIFTEGGADPFALINFVARFCSRGTDHMSAQQIWDQMETTFKENWNNYLTNAGLGKEK